MTDRYVPSELRSRVLEYVPYQNIVTARTYMGLDQGVLIDEMESIDLDPDTLIAWIREYKNAKKRVLQSPGRRLYTLLESNDPMMGMEEVDKDNDIYYISIDIMFDLGDEDRLFKDVADIISQFGGVIDDIKVQYLDHWGNPSIQPINDSRMIIQVYGDPYTLQNILDQYNINTYIPFITDLLRSPYEAMGL